MPSGDVTQAVEVIGAGLVAGIATLPHCAAMCGPLCAHLRAGRARNIAARYQLGRTLGYAFAGLLAGHFGVIFAELLPRAFAMRLFGIAAGVACLIFALRLLRGQGPSGSALPAADRRTDVAPEALVRPRRRGRAGRWTRVSAVLPRDPTALGGLSALLPCGSLYGALLLAAATADGGLGALLMAVFSLASAPAVLAFPLLGDALLRVRHRGYRRGLAVSLVLVGVALLAPASGDQARPADGTDGGEVRCH